MNASNGSSGRIVRANLVGTSLFVVTAVFAAAIFTTPFQWLGAITSLSLFAVGVFAFLWAYFHAVQRSRTEEIGVAQLYVLTGPPTPGPIRRVMLALLSVQIATAAITTFARLDGPDGDPGSSLAVGFLVPMLGFGLNGLWAAFHGTFPARRLKATAQTLDSDEEHVDDTVDNTIDNTIDNMIDQPIDDTTTEDSETLVVEVAPPIRKNDGHG